MKNQKIRNVAIIAHVDHGKTTLVDQMLKQGGVFRTNQHVADRVMDSNDLEKERGITILAKNTSINYKDYKINVVDTPGHADFGGEVERVLKMVNGVILLVDAYEGTMPQTRFVLKKALELNNKVVVVVNKIDRPDARVKEVCDEVLELLMELNATDEQLDSPIVYCSARFGTSTKDINKPNEDFIPLFDTIVDHIDPPEGDPVGPFQMLISALDYNDYVGAIGIGRVEHGKISPNTPVAVTNFYSADKPRKSKVAAMFRFEGLERIPVDEAESGEIVCISGIENLTIGDTICHPDFVKPIEFPKIDEPSVEMTFAVNDSPFAGKEGKFVTSRNLRERLYKECIKDVSLRVSDTESSEAFKVCGRGEMHLSILIENMRREGYEFQVSMPKVLFKTDANGKLLEPIDRMTADVPNDFVGAVMNKMGTRKGELVEMTPFGETRMKLEFDIPSRGLFGYKSEFLTDTKGEGIISSTFDRYDSHKGEIDRRSQGSLIVHETGETTAYGLYNAQERGSLFLGAGIPVYEGMIVGENAKPEDVVVNVCKKKQLTNMRASGSDESLRLTPPKVFSLEQSLTFIADDEYLEVTPKNIRIRKKILNASMRKKSEK